MMRISEIHIYQHELPVVGGVFRTSRTSMASLDTTIIEMVTENGLVGYGETCPLGPVYQPHHAAGARAALRHIGPYLIGLNALGIECVRDAMDEALSGHRYAKAAVDVALWDLAGKFYGARVCDLLGGAKQETVPSYYSIGVMEPEAAASMAREKQAEGYRRLQLKVGGRTLDIDISAIRKVHETLQPHVTLVVDVNRGWTSRDVCRAANLPITCDDAWGATSLRPPSPISAQRSPRACWKAYGWQSPISMDTTIRKTVYALTQDTSGCPAGPVSGCSRIPLCGARQ